MGIDLNADDLRCYLCNHLLAYSGEIYLDWLQAIEDDIALCERC